MNQALPFVPTKTTAPPQRAETVRRPRLLDLLRAGLPGQLSLVTAPSGFGKTALLADFVAELEVNAAWLTLDSWDRDPRELLASLTQAIDPGGQHDATSGTSAEGLRRQLRLLVWSAIRAGHPRVLVLDDFQVIEDSREAVGLIEELLEAASQRFHVVIASRGLPALGGLARLVARGSALCLGIEDLSFDEDEIKRLFAQARQIEITDSQARDLLQRTGGWAANLLLLSVTADGAIESSPKGELFLEDLLNDAYNRQTSGVRRFLLSASVLRVLEPDFCDELLSQTNSLKILKEVERRNVFASRIEAHPPVYRLHQPFREFLKGKLRAEKPVRFASLCLKAGRLCEEQADWEGAIGFYVEGQAWPGAIRALREAAESLLAYGRADTLGEWLDALPREVLRSSADMLLLRARARLDLGELDEALQFIADLMQQECPETTKSMALLYRCVCLSRKGQHQQAIRTGRSAVSLLMKNDATPQMEAEAHLRLGVAIGASGQFAKAVPSLRKALAQAESVGDVRTASIAADDLGAAFGNLGQIDEAQIYLEKARQGWANLGNDYRLVLTLNNLGMMYSLQGEYELGSQLLSEAIERSRATGNTRIEAIATLSLGDVKRDSGNYHRALELYDDGLEKARRLGEAYFIDYAVDALGMTYMLMGDLQKAEGLLKHAAAEVSERGGVYEDGLLSLSLGILSHLRGEFADSATRLEHAVRVLKGAGAAREEARAHFHLAHVYLATNNRRRALAALQEVARLVGEIGHSAFLAADARRCPALTAFASSKRIGEGLFTRLREGQTRRAAARNLSLGPTYPPVEAKGLGETLVTLDGRPITDSEWSSTKSKEMFFFFLSSKEPCSRDQCCAALWPEFDQTRATSNFHSTLYRLRSATYFDIVSNSNGRYRLNPAASFAFDVREFEAHVQEGDSRPSGDPERMRAFERASSTYGGPFGHEFYSEWAGALRRHLEDKYLRVLAALAGHSFAARNFESCLDLCDRIISIDEGNDEAHCLRIESFLSLGDRVSALRHLESYRRFLIDDAGTRPSRRLIDIGYRIAANHP